MQYSYFLTSDEDFFIDSLKKELLKKKKSNYSVDFL
jgi:hypothetical protein